MKGEMIVEELKPCPFCGGEARFVRGDVFNSHSVQCMKCHCFSPSLWTKEECTKEWNTRTTNWRKYPEEKPEVDGEYYVYRGEGNGLPHEAVYKDERGGFFTIHNWYPKEDITHWQPLPEPPTKEVSS